MSVCGKCRRVLRWDEHLSSTFIPDWGSGQVCPVCQAEVLGLPAPEPIRYPPGTPMPLNQGGGHLPVCGLCRIALPEGEQTRPLRLRAEMPETAERGIEPGCYAACQSCIEEWRPVVYRYLAIHEADRLPEGFSERNCRGNWLA